MDNQLLENKDSAAADPDKYREKVNEAKIKLKKQI